MIDQQEILDTFEEQYHHPSTVLGTAPGRVNLIGEHTDYNGGFVLPAAINRGIGVALAARDDQTIRLYSLNFKKLEVFEGILEESLSPSPNKWANYVLAVVDQFRTRGLEVSGFDAVLSGDVPLGSGLSSSAALEMAVAVGLKALFGFSLPGDRMALLGQAAEHSHFVGVQCGIMDQFISALGREGHALRIDCHTLDHEAVPLPPDRASILIANSMVHRGLVDSEYNRRRAECGEALDLLSQYEGRRFESLRHVGSETFNRHSDRLPDLPRRRARHVVTENDRVDQTVEALRSGDLPTVGRLLNASHESLRSDYEVSCRELDCLANLLQSQPGVYGARMTGAGFGGCVVAIVDPREVETVAKAIANPYREKTGMIPETFITPACGGAASSRIGKMA